MNHYTRPIFLVALAGVAVFAFGIAVFVSPGIGNWLLASVGSSTTVQAPQPIVSVVQTSLTNKFGFSLSVRPYFWTDADLNANLNDLVSLGVGWVRFDIPWVVVQPNGPTSTYSWNEVDRVVAAANAHNIKLVPILLQAPTWARSSDCPTVSFCHPADPAAFATFAQQVAQRYAPQGIHTWEIWNEPNILTFWQPAPNVAQYAALLKAAYPAIKAADPSATVISGGLSPAATTRGDISPTDFLAGLYQQGAGGYFDALGMHPYSYPVPPSTYESWNAWSQMLLTPTNLRGIMTANGDSGKAIWLTEFGAPTGGPGVMATPDNYQLGNSPDHVNEALQANIIADAVVTAQTYSWAGPLFIYTYKDLGTSPTTIENFFGLLRYDGTLKPSYSTLKSLLVPPPPPAAAAAAPTPAPATTTPTSTVVPAPTPAPITPTSIPPVSNPTSSPAVILPPSPISSGIVSTTPPTPAIDSIPPKVSLFDVQPRMIASGSALTVSFTVTDSGGSFLKYVALHRAPYNSYGCNDTDHSGCAWSTVKTMNAPAGSNSWTSTMQDNPTNRTWWYGLGVLDGVGHVAYEPAIIKVVLNPALPAASTGHRVPVRSR